MMNKSKNLRFMSAVRKIDRVDSAPTTFVVGDAQSATRGLVPIATATRSTRRKTSCVCSQGVWVSRSFTRSRQALGSFSPSRAAAYSMIVQQT